jgi:microcystin-dependent protein
MPYIVNFTDSNNKTPITVFDNTSSTDTSLTFPGRNVTGYGQIIAENFLHLLENFASAIQPVNPTEGQLWYDSENGVLMIWDNTNWKSASNIQKSPSAPSVETSKIGELWVDTTNQQLRIYSGTRWILVGPTESSIDGLRYGPAVESIVDSDNITRNVLTFYIADVAIVIFSKDSFTPKTTISGYTAIKSGMNINIPRNTTEIKQFLGDFLPKYHGVALIANALQVDSTYVPEDPTIVSASKFLRSDQVNTTEYGINIRNNSGITIGLDGTFAISTSSTSAKIYNSAAGSSLDLQVNRDGIASTVVRILDNKVGINKAIPEQALDIDGSILANGNLILTNTTESTNFSNGSFRTAGGVSITKNLLIGTGLDVTGTTQTNLIQPKSTDIYDNGTSLRRWKTVRAKTVIADEIQGVLNGNISGTAGLAKALETPTTFLIGGTASDIVSNSVVFDGQTGSNIKVFTATLTSNIINNKDEPFPAVSKKNDYVLVYRPSLAAASAVTATVTSGNFVPGTTYAILSLGTTLETQTDFTKIGAASNTIGLGFVATNTGATAGPLGTAGTGTATTTTTPQGLVKQNRDTFVGDLGIPIGGIIPYAGATPPYGFLYCDGSEVEKTKYPDLYDVIGTLYNGATPLVGAIIGSTPSTFRVPDLRGRFALGKDNMDNGGTVPNSTGGYVDGGGGNIDRVPDTKADILGDGAGSSSVALTLGNLPDHEHSLQNAGVQYSAIRVDAAINPPATTGLGPTAPGQTQYLNTSGPIKKPREDFALGTAVGIMNPYLTINYIVRSGPPLF